MSAQALFRDAPATAQGHFLRALGVLLQAHGYSKELGEDLWTFAVEIEALRTGGLTSSDLRWLCCKGYFAQSTEITQPNDCRRTFKACANLCFNDRTCFVLTDVGVSFARRVCGADGECAEAVAIAPLLSTRSPGHNPLWDCDRQELYLYGVIVKRFKAPAPNQEAILSAFQEEDWPCRIDDPIPQSFDQDPKRRLHDTINALNRNQKHRLLRFVGDGSGMGVRWELITAPPGVAGPSEAVKFPYSSRNGVHQPDTTAMAGPR